MWVVVALTKYRQNPDGTSEPDLASQKVFGLFHSKADGDQWIADTRELNDCLWAMTKEVTVWGKD